MPRMLVNIILGAWRRPILLFSWNLVGYGGKLEAFWPASLSGLAGGVPLRFFPSCKNHAVGTRDFICLCGGKRASNHSLAVGDSCLILDMTSGPGLLKKHMREWALFLFVSFLTTTRNQYLWLETGLSPDWVWTSNTAKHGILRKWQEWLFRLAVNSVSVGASFNRKTGT